MVTGFRDPEEQAGGASTRLLRFHAVCDALLFSAVAAGLESRLNLYLKLMRGGSPRLCSDGRTELYASLIASA